MYTNNNNNNIYKQCATYLGSQYMTLNSGLSLVTNISLSMSSSLMVGGGRAIANPTNPNKGGGCLRVNEKENCGRMCARICTT